MKSTSIEAAAFAFRNSLEKITKTIQSAINTYEASPDPAFIYAYRKWKDTALPRLIADRSVAEQCLADVENEGNAKALVSVASSDLGLSKKLDSFRFDFAGPDYDKELNEAVDKVVCTSDDLLTAIAGNN